MYIKQIIISNFRSFQNQDEIEQFSPQTNAIVGRNGSGKSNLFDAVQFVLLAPRFANLRQEERQAILHEGSGAAAVNAFVEIVFDNSDQRFALEASDEVVLRRTIGLKKDEFFLNRKRATKQEVQSLLEGAGFSKSNPYFIVQQGKVQDLCTMSDKDRLKLLKEVAGTTVYDEKKDESLLKMQENTVSIEKIQDILSDIDTRLQDLQSEKEELTNYQKLDRQRRALEYTLYDKELRKARDALDSIEQDRAEHVQVISKYHQAAKETHDAIQEVEHVLKTRANVLRRHKIVLDGLEEDARTAVKTVAKLELEIKDGVALLENLKEQSRTNQDELAAVDKEIAEAQATLDNVIEPAHENAQEALQRLIIRRDEVKRQLDALYAKEGRGKQFSSKEERDAYLRQSIKELLLNKQATEEELRRQQDSLSNLRRAIRKETHEMNKINQEVAENETILQNLLKDIDYKKKQRLEVIDRRKFVQRQMEDLRERVRDARENFHRATSNFRKVMPRATAMGIEALKTIVSEEGLSEDQYFGMVMENFKLKSDNFQVAVEVAAQNSLFHVIVDTDETAAMLMKRLEDGKLGRVTFLPLNQLVVESVQYPDSTDVRPILELCIDFNAKVARAMGQVFGKKLLARDPEVAAEWSTKTRMDAITLEGDLCSRKGALTGGYVDLSKSRLRAYSEKKAFDAELRDVELEYQTTNRQLQQADQDATNLMSELQRLESHHAELCNELRERHTNTERLVQRLENQKNQSDKIEKDIIPILEREIARLGDDTSRLEEELGSELASTMSDADRQLIHSLKQLQAQLNPEIESQRESLAKASVERQTLRSRLNENLLKRRRELSETVSSESSSLHPGGHTNVQSLSLEDQLRLQLERQRKELDLATQSRDELESRLNKGRNEMENIQDELVQAKNKLEQLKGVDSNNRVNLDGANDKAERLLNKRSMCMSKREMYMRKIAELGSLPPPTELDKFSRQSIQELMKSLDSVNKALKEYSHVNKKAFDQYVNFNEQRDQLLARKEELDREAVKVDELLETLDKQKDEAINRTFRGVSKHFQDVFSELVPQGAGKMILRTTAAGGMDTDDADDTDVDSGLATSEDKFSNEPNVSLYQGIGIKVRFSPVGENYMMSQLSGGQKALVAMALIFAIQRCDPAPFYLFDELDQALDSTFRSAVARMIKQQACDKESPTQFIVSTFRPELVETASKCYGVSLQSKVSSVHVMPKKDALRFIADLMHDEEAVGEVTSIKTSKSSATGSRKRKEINIEDESGLGQIENTKDKVQMTIDASA